MVQVYTLPRAAFSLSLSSPVEALDWFPPFPPFPSLGYGKLQEENTQTRPPSFSPLPQLDNHSSPQSWIQSLGFYCSPNSHAYHSLTSSFLSRYPQCSFPRASGHQVYSSLSGPPCSLGALSQPPAKGCGLALVPPGSSSPLNNLFLI